jgi:hypothetical protein
MATIPRSLAREVRDRAHNRCEYCRTSEWLSGQRHDIDHIFPRSLGGKTTSDNLCLACAPCNGFKADRTHALDPDSGISVALFNPRTQRWGDHFGWDEEKVRVLGLTPCGRATVSALKMNLPLILSARAIWVGVGRHPPQD